MTDRRPGPGAAHYRLVIARSDSMEIGGVRGHVVFPTADQGPWPPFERIAESEAGPAMKASELHPHHGEEVVLFVLSGRLVNSDESGRLTEMGEGAGLVIEAGGDLRHDVRPAPDAWARWISIVARLPPGTPTPGSPYHSIVPSPMTSVGTGVDRRALVGSRGSAPSSARLEIAEFALAPRSAIEIPLGPGRRTVAYVYEGAGRIQDEAATTQSAVLAENVERLMVEAPEGLRLFLASAPSPTYAAD